MDPNSGRLNENTSLHYHRLGYRNVYWNAATQCIWKHDDLYGTVKTARKHVSKNRFGLVHIGVEFISLNYRHRDTVILFVPVEDPKVPGFQVPLWKGA